MGGPLEAQGERASGEEESAAETEEKASQLNPSPPTGTSPEPKKPAAKRSGKTKAKLSREKREKPRRPLSAYNFFFREERERIMADDSNQAVKDQKDDPVALFVSVGKMVALRWKQISAKDKEPYIKMAEDDMERYQAEMNQYRLREAQKIHSSEKDDISSTTAQTSSFLSAFAAGAGAGQLTSLNRASTGEFSDAQYAMSNSFQHVPSRSRGMSVDMSSATTTALQQLLQKGPNPALSVVDAMNTLAAQGARGTVTGMPALSPLEQQLLLQQQLQQQQLQLQHQRFLHSSIPANSSTALLQALLQGEERRRQEMLLLQQLAQRDQQERLLSLLQPQQAQQQAGPALSTGLTSSQEPRFDPTAASALMFGASAYGGSAADPTQQPLMPASREALWGGASGHLGLLGAAAATSEQPLLPSPMAPTVQDMRPNEGGMDAANDNGGSSASQES